MKTTERQRWRLRGLLDDTTEGDWYARDVYVYRTDDPRDHRQVCRIPTVQIDPRKPHPDALFITAAKRDLPDHLTHILIDIQKSALLYRLIYMGEEVRTELCPEHLGNLEMGIWIGDPDAKSCVCGGTGWLPRPAGVPHPWDCSHKEIWDEPPQCASCQAYVCGNCGVLLGSPIGFCAKCAEATTPEALAERKRYCLPRTTIPRPDET